MPNPVTLSPEAALAAMNTLVFADNVLFNMAPSNRTAAGLREELLELRRSIARQYNAPQPPAQRARRLALGEACS